MRLDVKNLLARLGKNEFAYKEFEDRFSDLELWPILEALLKDPRLHAMANAEPPAHENGGEDGSSEHAAEQASEPLSSLFSRYENSPQEHDTQSNGQPDKDVRAMLRQLSELGAKGKI